MFAYEVADGDEDTDGVSIEAGRIASERRDDRRRRQRMRRS